MRDHSLFFDFFASLRAYAHILWLQDANPMAIQPRRALSFGAYDSANIRLAWRGWLRGRADAFAPKMAYFGLSRRAFQYPDNGFFYALPILAQRNPDSRDFISAYGCPYHHYKML